jgi:hypothetical protein
VSCDMTHVPFVWLVSGLRGCSSAPLPRLPSTDGRFRVVQQQRLARCDGEGRRLRCGNLAVWQYDNLTVWQCGGMGIWPSDSVATWRYDNRARWRSGRRLARQAWVDGAAGSARCSAVQGRAGQCRAGQCSVVQCRVDGGLVSGPRRPRTCRA